MGTLARDGLWSRKIGTFSLALILLKFFWTIQIFSCSCFLILLTLNLFYDWKMFAWCFYAIFNSQVKMTNKTPKVRKKNNREPVIYLQETSPLISSHFQHKTTSTPLKIVSLFRLRTAFKVSHFELNTIWTQSNPFIWTQGCAVVQMS